MQAACSSARSSRWQIPTAMVSASATTTSDPIAHTFTALAEQRRKALVAYITAGHPDRARSLALIRAIARAGADISEAAVEVPTVVFTYLNPLLAAGRDALARAARAGASGLLLTDLPVGADPEREARIAAGPLAFVRLVAPTTPAARMADIARHGSGFVYLISRLGVTGARDDIPADLPATVARLRSATSLPICVGFGIARPEQAVAVGRLADGVAVGSALVR